MAEHNVGRSRGFYVGIGVLIGIVSCAGLGAALSAADGSGPSMGAVGGAACGLVLGALAGSVVARSAVAKSNPNEPPGSGAAP